MGGFYAKRKRFQTVRAISKRFLQKREWGYNSAMRALTKISYALVASVTTLPTAFAEDPSAGIFGEAGGLSRDQLRKGDITFEQIPGAIMSVTNFFLAFAGTISVVMIIYGAFKLSLGSIESDKETAKKIVTAAVIGFVLSVSAWAIIKIVMNNL